MRSFTRRTIVGSGLATALSVSLFLRTAKAQTYPQRPVKVIVPYAAGGASDIIARLIAPEFERAMGQPFIVDNRGGGASMVGHTTTSQSRGVGPMPRAHIRWMAVAGSGRERGPRTPGTTAALTSEPAVGGFFRGHGGAAPRAASTGIPRVGTPASSPTAP